MAKKSALSLGRLILQLALGVMLAVAGIWAFQNGKGDDAVKALNNVFSGDAANIISKIFAVIEIVAGVLLVVELFAGDKFGKFDNILGIILIIVWIVAIVLIDFIGKGTGIFNGASSDVLAWLYRLANHLIILGALLYLND